jgi:hypothetical protein
VQRVRGVGGTTVQSQRRWRTTVQSQRRWRIKSAQSKRRWMNKSGVSQRRCSYKSVEIKRSGEEHEYRESEEVEERE